MKTPNLYGAINANSAKIVQSPANIVQLQNATPVLLSCAFLCKSDGYSFIYFEFTVEMGNIVKPAFESNFRNHFICADHFFCGAIQFYFHLKTEKRFFEVAFLR